MIEKLKLFRALIEGSADAIHVVDPATGRFLDVNESACRDLGYTRDEMLALTVFDVTADVDRAFFVAHNVQVKKAAHDTVEVLHRRRDGTTYPVEVSLSFVTLDHEYLVAIIHDITERKRTEDELRRMNAFLDSIIENIPNMLFLKDARTLQFVRFNRAGTNLMGCSPDDLLGKTDYDFFKNKEVADFFTEKDREVLRGKEVVDIPEESVQTRDKGERILHTRKVPILNANGEPEYLLGISEDITERKRAEKQLRQLSSAVEHSPASIVITDPAGNIEYVNPKFTAVSGYSPGEVIGKNPRVLKSGETPAGEY